MIRVAREKGWVKVTVPANKPYLRVVEAEPEVSHILVQANRPSRST
jgi:hypothetical protein